MKRKSSKLLAFMIALAMVVSSTGLAFAGETEGYIPAKKTAISNQEDKGSSKGDAERAEKKVSVEGISEKNNFPLETGMTQKTSGKLASLKGTEYATVQEAIDASSDGDTVTVLRHVDESLYIDVNITLDLNGFAVESYDATDVITVAADDVVIKNGSVSNLNDSPSDHATAIYIAPDSYASVQNVRATTVGGYYTDNISSAYYVAGHGYGAFYDCEVFYDMDYVTTSDWINCAYVETNGSADFIECDFEALYGDCCYINGDAYIVDCYFVSEEDDTSAINLGEYAEGVYVSGGYYWGDYAIYANSASDDYIMDIAEGEFVSKYKGYSAFQGNTDAFDLYAYNGRNTISSPSNWKEADNVLIYEGVAAPSTVKTNLTAANGTTKGYDDIKVTWSKVSAADGYRVNYKAGSGSYGNSKYYSSSKTRSRTVANLSDGKKYTFKVTPYVIINENVLSDGGTKCYSNKYKTSYTYTLKKVSLSSFSKSNGKVKVAWKNISGETGYQISKSTKKSGTNIVATVKSTSAKSKLVSATKGKYYYYKVRAYKTVDGKKIYGPWSDAKKYKR